VLTGLAIIFVQQAKQDLIEYVTDVLSQRFTPRHLNERAMHMFTNSSTLYNPGASTFSWMEAGIQCLGYQRQPYPLLWSCQLDGSLASCTYRRVSRFGQEPPALWAWESHTIADPSITVDPTFTGGSIRIQNRHVWNLAVLRAFDPQDQFVCGFVNQ